MFKLFNQEEILFSPVKGQVIPLEEVSDEIFNSKMMGDGVGLINEENKIFAPINATVVMIPSTKHAIGLRTRNGAEILIHIGLDTVNLNGKGFNVHVKNKEKVKKGDLLISIDRQLMERECIDLTTPIVITNSCDYKIDILKEKGNIDLSVPLIRLIKK